MTNLKDTIIVLQARMGSSRLPEKMMIPFFQGQGVFEILLQRFVAHYGKEHVILATTDQPQDDQLVQVCTDSQVRVYRGSESDVVERFIGAAGESKHIVRVCCDNPFLDLNSLDELIAFYFNNTCDYASFQFSNGRPVIKSHIGVFCEMFTSEALQRVAASTDDMLYREHVTNYMYAHPDLFTCAWKALPDYIDGRFDMRFTLDTLEDFKLLQGLYAEFNGAIELKQLIEFVDSNPSLKDSMQAQIRANEK